VQLNNEFSVDIPVAEVWELLIDLERVIPCMPGGALIGRDGDSVRGAMKIKIGPVGANFEGAAKFLELDEVARTATIEAAGDDPRGRTAAKALIEVKLTPDGDGTQVAIDTDLTLTGKLAQFGRGAIMDVSAKLIGQFTDNLQAEMMRARGESPAPVGGGASAGALGVSELASLVGPMMLKRVAPVLAGLAALVLVVRTVQRR
jgi:carbon monoxide dehydrogenase subunit G